MMYEKIAEIQKLLWKNDDIMSQETLFELQDYVADLLIVIAKKEGKCDKLLADFPWLYKN